MKRSLVRLAVVVCCVASACSGGSAAPDSGSVDAQRAPSSTTAPGRSSTTPTTPSESAAGRSAAPSVPVARVTDARGVDVVVESIERIVPLDGDIAEIVFALGLGEHVVATDLSATYPPDADALPQIGYQRALAIEPILEFEPTVLLATDIAGPPETLDAFERVGIPLVVIPTDVTRSGPARKIVAVADALGEHDRGVELAERVQGDIDAAIDQRPTYAQPPRVVTLYVRGTNTQLVLGRDFGVQWLIESAGGIDVADELGITESAPITSEAIVAATPDAILVPASGLESVGGVDGLLESVPALARTPAGRAGAILAYDDQLMLGNGPRTGQFLATLVTDLADLADPGPLGEPMGRPDSERAP